MLKMYVNAYIVLCMKRSVNKELLKERLSSFGKQGLEKVAIKAKVGHSTLAQLRDGRYRSQPKEDLRLRLAKVLSVDPDELFPFVGSGREKAS